MALEQRNMSGDKRYPMMVDVGVGTRLPDGVLQCAGCLRTQVPGRSALAVQNLVHGCPANGGRSTLVDAPLA